MTVSTFMIMFTAFAVLTQLFTEAVKKFMDDSKKTYSSNIVALIVSAIVSTLGSSMYYIYAGIQFTPFNILLIIVLILFTACGAMIGYDKVKQALQQIIGLKENKSTETEIKE